MPIECPLQAQPSIAKSDAITINDPLDDTLDVATNTDTVVDVGSALIELVNITSFGSYKLHGDTTDAATLIASHHTTPRHTRPICFDRRRSSYLGDCSSNPWLSLWLLLWVCSSALRLHGGLAFTNRTDGTS